jgi:hypothetical protein
MGMNYGGLVVMKKKSRPLAVEMKIPAFAARLSMGNWIYN